MRMAGFSGASVAVECSTAHRAARRACHNRPRLPVLRGHHRHRELCAMNRTHCHHSVSSVKSDARLLPPVTLMQPEQLAACLTAPDVLVVDVCSPTAGARPCIPAAVSLAGPQLQAGRPPTPGGLPALAYLEQLLGHMGYRPDCTLVVCDDEGGGWAGRLLWTLDLIGHRKLAYLDGGVRAWRDAGLPLQHPPRAPQPTRTRLRIENPQVRMTAEQIMVALAAQQQDPTRALALWDARSPEEFAGLRRSARRAGHIPGAVNFEWTRAMDPQRSCRLRQDLAEQLEAVGLGPDRPLLTYCQAHHRSGLAYMAARLLGYAHVSAYDGGWSEWGNRMDTPVITGGSQ